MNFKMLSYCLNWVQFKIAAFIFPVLELMFRLGDNWDTEVKKHFQQAQLSIEKGRISIAILNLNIVLSIKPAHFLSLALRGKIYLKEKRFKLASADFMKAYESNSYRFFHYGLYNDYNSCTKDDSQRPQSQDFLTVMDFFNQQSVKIKNETLTNEILPLKTKEHPLQSFKDSELTIKEQSKFSKMAPITSEEIQGTDWDILIKTLIIKMEE